jgi:hypothetical protein
MSHMEGSSEDLLDFSLTQPYTLYVYLFAVLFLLTNIIHSEVTSYLTRGNLISSGFKPHKAEEENMFKRGVGFTITVVTLLALLHASPAHAQIQSFIRSSQDNTIFEESDSLSNGAGRHMFVGRTNDGNIRRALLQFPVADSIPPGAVIQSTVLTLWMSKTRAGSETITLHRLLSQWGEGLSAAPGQEGGGALATSGSATWLYRLFATILWARAGGFYSFQQSAALLVTAIGLYSWGPTPEMVADVQHWLDNPDENFGWIMIGNETGTKTTKRFDTKEQFDQVLHPVLEVTYSEPTDVPEQGQKVPSRFLLSQNYPNPFNAHTGIRYFIPPSAAGSQVKLEIFNTLGQKVRTLVDVSQSSGKKSVWWDGRDESGAGVSSGIYVYRLEAGGMVRSKKMLFLK